jgi:thiamine-monophosphate kinase
VKRTRRASSTPCALIGGDIAFHARAGDPLTCSVTVLAEPIDDAHPPRARSGARAGDDVYVTGRLGGSLASGRHLSFEPRIAEAIALARALGDRLHAMIDISDGLGRDLGHIAAMSNLAIEIDRDALPCNDGCDWRAAIADGEDYELAFTATGPMPPLVKGLPIARIGHAMHAKTASVWLLDPNGHRLDISRAGWEHESS